MPAPLGDGHGGIGVGVGDGAFAIVGANLRFFAKTP